MKLSETRRRWVRRLAGAVLVLVVLCLIYFREPRYAVMGWMRGETFFEGKPTSLWREEVREYAAARKPNQSVSLLTKYLPFLFPMRGPQPPGILTANRNALPVLIELLDDPDRWVRREVFMRISQMGSSARPIYPSLVEMLNNKDPVVRQDAIYCMTAIDANQTDAILLDKALKHPETLTPTEVVWWLAKPAAENEEAFAVLCEMTRHPDEDGRESAMPTIVNGPARERARPLLLEWIRSPERERRRAAFLYNHRPGIPGLGPDFISPFPTREALPILIGWLDDEDDEWRKETLTWLGQFGPEAKEAVPAILRIVEDEDDPAYNEAWMALNQIDRDAARKFLPAEK